MPRRYNCFESSTRFLCPKTTFRYSANLSFAFLPHSFTELSTVLQILSSSSSKLWILLLGDSGSQLSTPMGLKIPSTSTVPLFKSRLSVFETTLHVPFTKQQNISSTLIQPFRIPIQFLTHLLRSMKKCTFEMEGWRGLASQYLRASFFTMYKSCDPDVLLVTGSVSQNIFMTASRPRIIRF